MIKISKNYRYACAKTLIRLVFLCLLSYSCFGQGNIPKGYFLCARIVPPDTSYEVADVFWPYGNSPLLFVKYRGPGVRDQKKILVVTTGDWRNVAWLTPSKKGYWKIFACTPGLEAVIVSYFTGFLFFRKEKFEILHIATGQTKKMKANEYGTLAAKYDFVGLKSFLLSGYLLSDDQQYFTYQYTGLGFLRNYTDLRQRSYELLIFKYADCK